MRQTQAKPHPAFPFSHPFIYSSILSNGKIKYRCKCRKQILEIATQRRRETGTDKMRHRLSSGSEREYWGLPRLSIVWLRYARPWENSYSQRDRESRRNNDNRKMLIKLIESGSVSAHRHHRTKRSELKRSVRTQRKEWTCGGCERTYKRYFFYLANKYVLCSSQVIHFSILFYGALLFTGVICAHVHRTGGR